jgi:hypothetical protein
MAPEETATGEAGALVTPQAQQVTASQPEESVSGEARISPVAQVVTPTQPTPIVHADAVVTPEEQDLTTSQPEPTVRFEAGLYTRGVGRFNRLANGHGRAGGSGTRAAAAFARQVPRYNRG